MPPLLHAVASSSLIGRDAPAIAISPRQNFLNPPPVPDTPTVTWPPFSFWNSSANAWRIGNTVEEPSILITAPATFPGSAGFSADLPAPSAPASPPVDPG